MLANDPIVADHLAEQSEVAEQIMILARPQRASLGAEHFSSQTQTLKHPFCSALRKSREVIYNLLLSCHSHLDSAVISEPSWTKNEISFGSPNAVHSFSESTLVAEIVNKK